MRMQRKSVVLACLIVLLIGIAILNAQWVENGVPICTEDQDQDFPQIVTDGKGGAIIGWQDERSGNWDIYARRINDKGYTQWTLDGAAVCTLGGDQEDLRMITDDAGGAIITWDDYRAIGGGIYVQRMDSSGSGQWAENGVVVCTLATLLYDPRITTDGSSGAIIAWEDSRNGHYDIYAQKIDADGNLIWADSGIGICNAIGNQRNHEIISDGAGGAIVAWPDQRVGSYDVYAQRIDGSGTVQWTADGIAVCATTSFDGDLYMISDGSGGAIIAWADDRDGDRDIYMQRISMNGVAQWTSDGMAVTATDIEELYPRLVLTSNNDIIMTWDEQGPVFEDYTFLVRRVGLDGQFLWPGGLEIVATPWVKGYPDIISDGLGGAIVAYYDIVNMQWGNISAQRVNENGIVMWPLMGVPVFRGNYDLDYLVAISDGQGGAIVAWNDNRNGSDLDVFALKLNRAGFIGDYYPAPSFSSIEDIPKDQGGRLSLRWHRSEVDSFPNADITYYSLWRLLPDAGASPLAVEELRSLEELGISEDFKGTAKRYLPLSQGYAWEWLDNIPARQAELYAYTVESLYDSIGTDPGWQHFVVTAQTADLLVYFDSPVDSGYSVDNLSPAQPTGFAGIQSLAPQGLRLSWLPNSESDLYHYSIHRGDNELFVPDGSNLVGTTTDTVLIDTAWIATDHYFYKMSAVDVHGNAGPEALLRPEDITVGTLLQSCSAALVGDRIEVSWTLSEAGEGMEFFVLKARGETGTFTELLEPEIEAAGLSFTFKDSDTEPGEVYRYRVEVGNEGGRRMLFETEPVTTPPMALTLYQNHPNPFNPSTTIRYYLPEGTHVTLDVYDVSGKRIARLIEREQEKGTHNVEWNGRDDQGNRASSGVYFYRLTAGKETFSKKMIMLR